MDGGGCRELGGWWVDGGRWMEGGRSEGVSGWWRNGRGVRVMSGLCRMDYGEVEGKWRLDGGG